ncbi:Rieske (2Fe-2S) protein [Alicyclobacillus ferrooxydans]|uniref:Rieske domain-containing protein n=1 Tax=Alicyclobacillus ferrooxydans TaxID=471514 RepID=A0A0P9CEM1_9BACL|nr:non-heme iron oxygenase ferredoxin subunit [Alicyclobacillus ferrooxydans]KPV44057.1 hypothetical protein AN477_09195 [Alicyclobacillus ferrooxydans]
MSWQQVGRESDIAVRDMKSFVIQGEAITVYHLDEGWYATSDICTHQDCSLSEGDIEGEEIVCWCHGGAFDIKSGRATRMPCTVPVEAFQVQIRDGWIEVDLS